MEHLTKTCRVGAYIRLSKEDVGTNKESESITNQRQYIKEYAEKNGMTIYDYYVDDGYTGSNFDRPNFKRLIKDIELGAINTVITKDTSRLGRDFIETGYYITKFFPENNIRYIAINDNYDSNTPDSMYNDIMIGFKSIMNDRYIKDASVKIKEIKRMKTEQGYYMGFIAPYGYIKEYAENKITLRVDEESSRIVKRIFYEMMSITGRMRESGKEKEKLERELEKLIEQKELVKKREELENKYSELITEENIYKFAFKDLIKKVIFKKDRSIVIEFDFDVMPKYKFQM